jgi:hypothetical protein
VSAIYDKPSNRLRANPDLWKVVVAVARAINKFNKNLGLPEQKIEEIIDSMLVIDETTSEEEALMDCITFFLKRGYSLEEAEEAALEIKQLIESP